MRSLQLDKRGNVIVYGSSYPDSVLAKYDGKNGKEKWVVATGLSSNPYPMAVRGNAIYIAGTQDGNVTTNKYKLDGHLKWSRSWTGATSLAIDVQIGRKKRVHVLGSVIGGSTAQAQILIYNKKGKLLYEDTYSYANEDIVTREMSLSCGGDFYFTGWDDFSAEDIILVKYEACQGNNNVRGQCVGTSE